jgi:hypothetical protein
VFLQYRNVDIAFTLAEFSPPVTLHTLHSIFRSSRLQRVKLHFLAEFSSPVTCHSIFRSSRLQRVILHFLAEFSSPVTWHSTFRSSRLQRVTLHLLAEFSSPVTCHSTFRSSRLQGVKLHLHWPNFPPQGPGTAYSGAHVSREQQLRDTSSQ